MVGEKYSLERSSKCFQNYYHSKCSVDSVPVHLSDLLVSVQGPGLWPAKSNAADQGATAFSGTLSTPEGKRGLKSLPCSLAEAEAPLSLQGGQHLVKCGSVLACFGISRDRFGD